MWTGFVVAIDRDSSDASVHHRIRSASPRDIQAQSSACGRHRSCAGLAQIAMLLTLLAHQAWLMTDAIVRTLFRLFVSHRRLLEWVTAAQAKLTTRLDLRGFYRSMAGGVVLGAAAAMFVVSGDNRAGLVAAPFVILWMLSPAIARWASLPPPIAGTNPVSPADAQALRLSARRTWRFFEKFVTAEDNMLPPDNFQEDPTAGASPSDLAHQPRTLSSVSDNGSRFRLGWCERNCRATGRDARIDEPTRAFSRPLLQLVRNPRSAIRWNPKYVSSVDSGNLAGHLIALGNACREMITRPVLDPQRIAGMEDLIALARESLALLAP